MKTKSIRLTDEEAKELQDFISKTGIVEAAALKQAALRGLRETRLDHALVDYLNNHNSSRAAEVAGLPRAEFLQVLVERGVSLLEGPSTLASELSTLGEALKSDRLRRAGRGSERVPA